MPRYVRLGQLPEKRHTQFRKPDGGLYAEEVFGTHGFSGPMSILYHINLPTEVKSWEDRGSCKPEYLEDEALRHRHFRTRGMTPKGDAISGRVVLMGNNDVLWSNAYVAEEMPYFFKNAEMEEVLFMHDGNGYLDSWFGRVHFKAGDYVVVPRGAIYKLTFESYPVRMLVIESHGVIEVPRRYRNDVGQILEHAPYQERDFRPPTELITIDDRTDHQVLIKARQRYTLYTYPYNPLDVVGWDGYVFPYAFSIHDFAPITGKLHMPPPIHQTFQGHNFVICSFCPRQLDYHPNAVVVPYNHSNVDSDEILYYCNDKFGSRKGIEEGSITMHPLGIPHGPQPGAVEASLGATRTEELAVMLDTYYPLKVTKAALGLEDPDYWKSWQVKVNPTPGMHHTTGD